MWHEALGEKVVRSGGLLGAAFAVFRIRGHIRGWERHTRRSRALPITHCQKARIGVTGSVDYAAHEMFAEPVITTHRPSTPPPGCQLSLSDIRTGIMDQLQSSELAKFLPHNRPSLKRWLVMSQRC